MAVSQVCREIVPLLLAYVCVFPSNPFWSLHVFVDFLCLLINADSSQLL